MNSPEYIQNAIRTEGVPESIQINQMTLVITMKMAILTAKLADLVKRKIFYGKDIDITDMQQICMHIAEGARILAMAPTEGVDLNTRETQEKLVAEGAGDLNLDNLNIRLLHAALGCFTESGELIEALDKQLTSGKLDLVNFGEEIGDIEWYQAIGFDETGVTEAHCRERNISKLKARYPEKFNADQAINRDLATERTMLEGKA